MMDQEEIDQLRQYSRKLLRELGILQLGQKHLKKTPAHWHALIEVSKNNSLTISELSHYLLLSNSATSRLISILIKEDLLTFQQGIDRREKYLRLTAKGQAEIQTIDDFSNIRIKGACELLSELDQHSIVTAIGKYAEALEQSRQIREHVKILTLSTSRTIRKQIVHMIEHIQQHELAQQISPALNACIFNAETNFYYNNSYNFWYAVSPEGEVIGSIGLYRLSKKYAELKKLFVLEKYRAKGVAQKLMASLTRAAKKHGITTLYLGTVETAQCAQYFYTKYGFSPINSKQLPNLFNICPLDNHFFKGQVVTVNELIEKSLFLG